MTLVWTSHLRVEPYDRHELREAMAAGIIPHGVDITQPWCRLCEPLSLVSGRIGTFQIPEGFIYDQGSLPAAVRWWMGPSDPRINKAACWHDFLSPWPGQAPEAFGGRILSSVEAADELYDGMRASDANMMDAAMCSRAVKTFGPKWAGRPF